MFPYSGSKRRFQHILPAPPSEADVVVEPFAGALAYSEIHRPARVAWAEAAPLVRGVLNYLAEEATIESLAYLESTQPTQNIDCFLHQKVFSLTDEETTLVRLKTSGLYVGQLSSRVLYPQHKLTFKRAKEALGWFQAASAGGFHDYKDVPEDLKKSPTAWWVIDPPYLDTSANYQKGHGTFNPQEFRDWFATLETRGMVLYGDGAEALLPGQHWVKYAERKTSRGRAGGTRMRSENVLYFDTRRI